MGELFGTDGIRAKANTFPMDCETALKVGRAVAAYFGNNKRTSKLLIGRDARISGGMLTSALSAGICSMGVDVHLAGIIPTPAVAYLTKKGVFDAGIVISASHNPFFDNGIKIFKKDGFKLSDSAESEIEALIADPRVRSESESITETGRIYSLPNAKSQYIEFLKDTFPELASLEGLRIALDCSNGAASHVAPGLFTSLGADVELLACNPNGKNINDNCGSQHPQKLAQMVKDQKADMGLAFDGDADRLIAVDETGTVLTGDQIIAVFANELKTKGLLKNNMVVTTVMSNMGLGSTLKEMGIKHVAAAVGDRYVMEKMIEHDAVLGGEDSGHMIFLDHHTTGDGLLAALGLIQAMTNSDQSLSELSRIMTVYPQVLINVEVSSKPDLNNNGKISKTIKSVERRLNGRGRVLVRYSGTQPVLRIMVESPSESETHSLCTEIADVVTKELG